MNFQRKSLLLSLVLLDSASRVKVTAFHLTTLPQASGISLVRPQHVWVSPLASRKVTVSPTARPIVGCERLPLSLRLLPSQEVAQHSEDEVSQADNSEEKSQEGQRRRPLKGVSLLRFRPGDVRDFLRSMTGFSWTAVRTFFRKTTGLSFTAMRTTMRAATGISLSGVVRSVNARILSIFPAWLRYFFQPFLIMYYVPLMVLRSWAVNSSPSSRQARLATRESVWDSWRKAVSVAEQAQDGGYWPVHVTEDGYIEAVLPPDPDAVLLNYEDAIAESVQVARALEYNSGAYGTP